MGLGVTLSASGKRLFVNEAFVRIFGFRDKQEALAWPAGAQVAPEDWARFQAYRDSLKPGEVSVEAMDVHATRRDGTPIITNVSAVAVMHRGQRAVLSVVRDVTKEREAIEALRVSEEASRQRSDELGAMFAISNILLPPRAIP
ncbi:MAG: PAS domain S-box protein [SAR202 cluster bacterium]|nr:PAS domain S-box protein [SAR202 cluster bacterium]